MKSSLVKAADRIGNQGIRVHLKAPETHSRLAERAIRSVKDRVRAILCTCTYKLPLKTYDLLLQHAVTLINYYPNSNGTGLTPWVSLHTCWLHPDASRPLLPCPHVEVIRGCIIIFGKPQNIHHFSV